MTFILKPIYEFFRLAEDFEKNKKKIQKMFKQLNDRDLDVSFTNNATCKEYLLQQTFKLAQSVFDSVLINISAPGNTKNRYLQKVAKLETSFVGVLGKNLSDLDLIESKDQAQFGQRHFSLLRIAKSSKKIFVGEKFTAHGGQQFVVKSVWQPLGKQFKKLNYSEFAEGAIIGVETDVQVPSNSVVFQNFQQRPQEELHTEFQLSATAFSAGAVEFLPV